LCQFGFDHLIVYENANADDPAVFRVDPACQNLSGHKIDDAVHTGSLLHLILNWPLEVYLANETQN
jgi:hypothetical protein